jgi:hypothetical protein
MVGVWQDMTGSGNGDRTLPDSGYICQTLIFVFYNFFVQVKSRKIFSRKSFFLMLRLFRRKMVSIVMVSTKSFKKNNNFLENIFRCLVCTKKLRKVKIQLSPESGNVGSPLPDFDEHV